MPIAGWERDYHQIIADILETAAGGVAKSHIMKKVKLNYTQLEKYLPMLVQRGYLEKSTIKSKHGRKTQVLKTTKKGEQFLENFRLLDL